MVTLRSDRGYVGVLAYNPVHSDYATVYPRSEPYDLAELARALPANCRRPARAADLATELGRNCSLYAALCKLALGGSDEGLLTWARTLNSEFAVPLPESEVRGIWRSVCRYRARRRVQGHQQAWLWKQAARAGRGGTRGVGVQEQLRLDNRRDPGRAPRAEGAYRVPTAVAEGAAVGGLRLCGTRCDYRLVLSCCDGGDRRVAAGRCSRVVELTKGQGHLRVATNEEFNVRIPAAAPVPVTVTLLVSAAVPVMVEPLTVPLIASDTVMRSTSPPPEGHSIPVTLPTSAATAVKATDELPAVPAYRVLVPVGIACNDGFKG